MHCFLDVTSFCLYTCAIVGGYVTCCCFMSVPFETLWPFSLLTTPFSVQFLEIVWHSTCNDALESFPSMKEEKLSSDGATLIFDRFL